MTDCTVSVMYLMSPDWKEGWQGNPPPSNNGISGGHRNNRSWKFYFFDNSHVQPGYSTNTKKLGKLLGHFIGFWAVSLRNYWTVRWKPHSSAQARAVQLEYLTVVISSHKTRAGQAGTLPLHTLRKQQISSPP